MERRDEEQRIVHEKKKKHEEVLRQMEIDIQNEEEMKRQKILDKHRQVQGYSYDTERH